MEREPAKGKTAGGVSPGDGSVKVYGTVVSLSEGKLVLDDGGTSIEVFLNNPGLRERLGSYRPGDQMVVIGTAVESGIEGEIVRRMSGYEPSRYKQVLEVWKNVRSED